MGLYLKSFFWLDLKGYKKFGPNDFFYRSYFYLPNSRYSYTDIIFLTFNLFDLISIVLIFTDQIFFYRGSILLPNNRYSYTDIIFLGFNLFYLISIVLFFIDQNFPSLYLEKIHRFFFPINIFYRGMPNLSNRKLSYTEIIFLGFNLLYLMPRVLFFIDQIFPSLYLEKIHRFFSL